MRRPKGAFCLAVAALILFHSSAWAQERGATKRIVSGFSASISSGADASRGAGNAARTFSTSLSGEVSTARRLEDQAVDIISSILQLSDVDSYKEQPAAGLRLSHTTAALELELPVMRESRLGFVADFGVGATRLRSHELGQVPSDRSYRFSERFYSLLGGLTVRYALTNKSHAFVGVRHMLYFNDGDGLSMDEAPDAGRLLDSSSWTFPLTVGFQINFR